MQHELDMKELELQAKLGWVLLLKSLVLNNEQKDLITVFTEQCYILLMSCTGIDSFTQSSSQLKAADNKDREKL